MVTWDEAKRRQNLAKHGLDLADAQRFDLDTAKIEEDRDATGERRFRATGWLEDKLRHLVFTFRGDEVRVISLRPVTPKERRNYEEEPD
jgi:uncharacterized DUF497 family protein